MVERFVVCTGDADTFDVLEGRRLNDKPLARTEAYRLAGSSAVAVLAPKPQASGFSRNGQLVSWTKP